MKIPTKVRNATVSLTLGAIVAAGLTVVSPAKATHISCTEAAQILIDKVNEEGESVVGGFGAYGYGGQISPDVYDRCLIELFEQDIEDYTIKLIKKDPSWGGGTTYNIIKKQG